MSRFWTSLIALVSFIVGNFVPTVIPASITAKATKDAAVIPAEISAGANLKEKCIDEFAKFIGLAQQGLPPERAVLLMTAQLDQFAVHCELAESTKQHLLAYVASPSTPAARLVAQAYPIPTARPIATIVKKGDERRLSEYSAKEDRYVETGKWTPGRTYEVAPRVPEIFNDGWTDTASFDNVISSDDWGLPTQAKVGDFGWTMVATARNKRFAPIFLTKLDLVGGFVPAQDDPKNLMRPKWRTYIRENTEFPDGTGKNPAESVLETDQCVRVTEFVPRDDVLWARVLVIDCPTK